MSSGVYAKTDTGRKEVARRTLALNRRQRTLLILIDGCRPCSALDGMMPDARVAELVGELLATEVVRRIEGAADETALLAVVGHWHMALQASKHGREAALAHVERIRESLAGLAPA